MFAYGQTGAGKTYTMSGGGDAVMMEDGSGIIPRVVHDVFQNIDELEVRVFSVLWQNYIVSWKT